MAVKYDKIGTDYNLTRKADPLLTDNLLKHLAPTKEGLYLDIGCGTGSYTIQLQQRGYKWIGIDPSEQMLEKARLRNEEIDWRVGSAEKTGLAPNQVDGIMATLTIHHWTSLEASFAELSAVLKPGGKIVIFTSTPEQMKGYWLNHYFPMMLKKSIDQMPSFATVKKAMERAGLDISQTEKYFIQPDLADKFLYCGKHDPSMYFNEQIRNGISSFSSLSNKAEVEKGLAQLTQDMGTGAIHDIIGSYDNQLGDYLYLVGQKGW